MGTVLFLGGAFNTLILGIQLYFYLMALLVVVIIVHWILWEYRWWRPLKFVRGIWYGYRSGQGADFVGDIDMNLDLITEQSALGVFDEETIHESKVYERDWPKVHLCNVGGIPTDVVFDAADWTTLSRPGPTGLARWVAKWVYRTEPAPGKPSLAREAIQRCVEVWNEHDLAKKRENDPRAEYGDDEIHSLLKFQRKLLAGQITCPDLTDSMIYVTIPWVRIDMAFIEREKVLWEGWTMQRGRDRAKEADTLNNHNYFFYILGFFVLLALFQFLAFRVWA
jgi:hypothetical protein